MATGLAAFAVILSLGNLLALLFVVALVITLARPDRQPPAHPAITDAEAACDICVWCGKQDPSGMFGWGIDHTAGCPTVTDIWPVIPVDIRGDLTCSGCSHPFEIGEAYKSRPQIRCIGCAAIEELA
jgi:hypothetical protein